MVMGTQLSLFKIWINWWIFVLNKKGRQRGKKCYSDSQVSSYVSSKWFFSLFLVRINFHGSMLLFMFVFLPGMAFYTFSWLNIPAQIRHHDFFLSSPYRKVLFWYEPSEIMAFRTYFSSVLYRSISLHLLEHPSL